MKLRKIILVLVISLIGIIKVNAGYIRISTDNLDKYLYGNSDLITIDGITYDENTNTLTFKNYSDATSYDIGIYDLGDVTILIDGESTLKGRIRSNTNSITIKGINNGTLNLSSQGIENSNNQLNVEDVTLNLINADFMYGSPGLSAKNIVINNSIINSSTYLFAPTIAASENVEITNSTINDDSYNLLFNIAGKTIKIKQTNINVKNRLYDEVYESPVLAKFGVTHSEVRESILQLLSEEPSYYKPYYRNGVMNYRIIGLSLLAGSNLTNDLIIEDSNVSIDGYFTCLTSNESIKLINSDLDLRCYQGITTLGTIDVDSSNVNINDSKIGIYADTLKFTSGSVTSKTMSDSDKETLLNALEANGYDVNYMLEGSNFAPYKITNIELNDDYGIYVDGNLIDTLKDPLLDYTYVDKMDMGDGEKKYYIKNSDEEEFNYILSEGQAVSDRLDELGQDPNADPDEISALETQLNTLFSRLMQLLVPEDQIYANNQNQIANLFQIKLKADYSEPSQGKTIDSETSNPSTNDNITSYVLILIFNTLGMIVALW